MDKETKKVTNEEIYEKLEKMNRLLEGIVMQHNVIMERYTEQENRWRALMNPEMLNLIDTKIDAISK